MVGIFAYFGIGDDMYRIHHAQTGLQTSEKTEERGDIGSARRELA